MTESVWFTRVGYDQITEELTRLKSIERPKIIEEIATARAHGDLKENAEYHAAREKQSFVEGRISLLDDALARAKVVDDINPNEKKVQFGAWVIVEDVDTEEEKTIQIVGDFEANLERNMISLKSPLAKALLGKSQDEEITFRAPKGEICYLVKHVSYGKRPESVK